MILWGSRQRGQTCSLFIMAFNSTSTWAVLRDCQEQTLSVHLHIPLCSETVRSKLCLSTYIYLCAQRLSGANSVCPPTYTSVLRDVRSKLCLSTYIYLCAQRLSGANSVCPPTYTSVLRDCQEQTLSVHLHIPLCSETVRSKLCLSTYIYLCAQRLSGANSVCPPTYTSVLRDCQEQTPSVHLHIPLCSETVGSKLCLSTYIYLWPKKSANSWQYVGRVSFRIVQGGATGGIWILSGRGWVAKWLTIWQIFTNVIWGGQGMLECVCAGFHTGFWVSVFAWRGCIAHDN